MLRVAEGPPRALLLIVLVVGAGAPALALPHVPSARAPAAAPATLAAPIVPAARALGPVLSELRREPPEDGLEKLRRAKKHPRAPGLSSRGAAALPSEGAWDWGVLGLAFLVMLLLHAALLASVPEAPACHAAVLFWWLSLGGFFSCWILYRHGVAAHHDWLAGYLLELGCSVEVILTFHAIIDAFETPTRHVKKALLLLICVQVLLKFLFGLGLAKAVQYVGVLPYVLAIWFFFCAAVTGIKGLVQQPESIAYLFRDLFRGRVFPSFNGHARGIIDVRESWGLATTLLGPLVIVLAAVDFLLEIDVALSKSEIVSNAYIAFSSAVFATFAVNALYMLARDCFVRFPALRFGQAIVLLYFGMEVLASRYIEIPAALSYIMVCGLSLCLVPATWCLGWSTDTECKEAEFEHLRGKQRLPPIPEYDHE